MSNPGNMTVESMWVEVGKELAEALNQGYIGVPLTHREDVIELAEPIEFIQSTVVIK